MLLQPKLLHINLIGQNSGNQNFAEEFSPSPGKIVVILYRYSICYFKPLSNYLYSTTSFHEDIVKKLFVTKPDDILHTCKLSTLKTSMLVEKGDSI